MLLRILTVIAFLLSIYVIASVGLQTPVGNLIKQAVGHVPYGDKTLHFTFLTGLSFLLNASLRGRKAKLGKVKFLQGSLLVALAITLEECSQAFIPSRNFEFLDMVCNYAGVYTGGLLLLAFPSLENQT